MSESTTIKPAKKILSFRWEPEFLLAPMFSAAFIQT
jgi:hypothetical protein